MPRDIFTPSKGFIPFASPFDISSFLGPLEQPPPQEPTDQPGPSNLGVLDPPPPGHPSVPDPLQGGAPQGPLPPVVTFSQPPEQTSKEPQILDDSLLNIQNSSFVNIMSGEGDDDVFSGNVTSGDDSLSEGLFLFLFYIFYIPFCSNSPFILSYFWAS